MLPVIVTAEIHKVSEEISTRMTDISRSTEQLPNGATEQTASAEEVSVSMEEMAS